MCGNSDEPGPSPGSYRGGSASRSGSTSSSTRSVRPRAIAFAGTSTRSTVEQWMKPSVASVSAAYSPAAWAAAQSSREQKCRMVTATPSPSQPSTGSTLFEELGALLVDQGGDGGGEGRMLGQ